MCGWRPKDTDASPFACLRLVYTARDAERRPRPPGWCGHPHNAHWVCESRHAKKKTTHSLSSPPPPPPDFSGATTRCRARDDEDYGDDAAFTERTTLPSPA
ncbi:MAG: hypothetical protein CMI16_07100 [Opitutaceae bacterium]|nr:hypothetical protein [Opitutaceae bacterium]